VLRALDCTIGLALWQRRPKIAKATITPLLLTYQRSMAIQSPRGRMRPEVSLQEAGGRRCRRQVRIRSGRLIIIERSRLKKVHASV
jgi:hypothetical protein